ncbi:lytic murein transglycosylase [Pseudovibrio sp. SPO723]|uniref:lytic murein transglycosylase n=1 Tax=Nesiotobacter zosterae TaxID=392721 RepID=UPI0029C30C22|nr:lytic murein transglycosylase [Pseudovibrio sp. SPO723]MDX5595735.1 lytic murein transglycosylase [Pseudovibrio sp. SPO723]
MRKIVGLCLMALLFMTGASHAAVNSCGNNSSGFNQWLEAYKKQARAEGFSPRTIEMALGGVTYHSRVISYDRNQKSFKMSFDDFYKLRVNNALINKGRKLMRENAALFDRIEERFGVPREIVVAIWGLETGYGRNIGNMSTMRSLATLAYDCRRADFFRNELRSALLIVEKGDLDPIRMKGAWAGELGQTQFLASSYIKFALDFDGDGKRDLLYSVPDALGSTAHYLQAYGWRFGEPWGPGTPNHEVIRAWNKAGVYVKTIQVMAEKLTAPSN